LVLLRQGTGPRKSPAGDIYRLDPRTFPAPMRQPSSGRTHHRGRDPRCRSTPRPPPFFALLALALLHDLDPRAGVRHHPESTTEPSYLPEIQKLSQTTTKLAFQSTAHHTQAPVARTEDER